MGYGADHLVAATFVQRNWSAKKKDIKKSFSRNAPFAKRNHSSRGFFDWCNIDGVFFMGAEQFGHLLNMAYNLPYIAAIL